jgi:dUTP pyrophosphatase
MKVKIKKLNPDAKLPTYGSEGAACMDLYADFFNSGFPYTFIDDKPTLVKTGIAVAVPKGYELQIRPRSGLALKEGITVVNSPGCVDSDYRGEVGVILQRTKKYMFKIKQGDRIAQCCVVPIPKVEWEWVSELDETERGAGGYGSTGVAIP